VVIRSGICITHYLSSFLTAVKWRIQKIYYHFSYSQRLTFMTLGKIIIIIIIIIFITSAALSKIRRAAGTCHLVLTKRCTFKRRAEVAMDSVDRRSSAGKLFQVSGPETAKLLRPMAVADWGQQGNEYTTLWQQSASHHDPIWINPEIWRQTLDRFWLRSDALAKVCTLWPQSCYLLLWSLSPSSIKY